MESEGGGELEKLSLNGMDGLWGWGGGMALR